MESRREIIDGEQEIVEEVVDDGDVYDELVLGEGEEAIYLDGEDIDVVDEYGGIAAEYIQLQGGRIVPSSQHVQRTRQIAQQTSHIRTGQVQARRPVHNENSTVAHGSSHVYTIRGNQVYRVDKNASGGTEMKPMGTKTAKPDPDAPGASTSSTPMTNRQAYAATPFRREGSFFNTTATLSSIPIAKPKKKTTVGNRKPCNCTKSMCLKLYCECFANGEFCRDCNCKECHNNLTHEGERSRAIRSSLERNPNAFKPKIVAGGAAKGRSEIERLHMKGCHCKKSNCLKNYCECYEAKVACTDRCKCAGCKNTEVDRASKFRDRLGPTALLSLANVASLTGDNRNDTPFSDDDSDSEPPEKPHPKTMPWFYLTDEVVEASTLCLVAQAEDLEQGGEVKDEVMERLLMAEFASCLKSIIDSATEAAKNASKPSPPSPPPDLSKSDATVSVSSIVDT